jgi:hypothetical protein
MQPAQTKSRAPFQYSVRRLLVATALFALAAWLGGRCWHFASKGTGDAACMAQICFTFIATIVCCIAGCGAILERQASNTIRPLIAFVFVATSIFAGLFGGGAIGVPFAGAVLGAVGGHWLYRVVIRPRLLRWI